MLISYALDAAATTDGHGMDTLSERFLGHKPIAFSEVAGSGRNFVGFARVADRQGDRIRGRGRRRDAEAVAGAEAPARRRASGDGLRDAGAADGRCARPHGAARRLDRSRHALAPRRRLRPEHGAPRGGDQPDRRRPVQSGLAEAARRHSVRPDGSAGRQEDRDRRLVDHGERARRPRRRGSRAAGARARMAAVVEAEVDLRRRAARLRQSLDRPGAHVLRPRRHHDRAALVVRAEPAEHSRSAPRRAGRSAAPSSPRRARS